MYKKVLGLIDATDRIQSLVELTKFRCLAAVPFGARYRLIDFILSSMVSSGITNVAVSPNDYCRSLWSHLGSGKNWDLMRKRDGLFILSPAGVEQDLEQERERSRESGGLSYFKHHLEYFKQSEQSYVLIAKGNIVANIDFREILTYHLESEVELTEVVTRAASLEMYILSKSLFISILEDPELLQYGSISNLLKYNPNQMRIATFVYEGFAQNINSLLSYFQLNLELINRAATDKLLTHPMIRTKEKDDPPTIYKKHAHVSRSLIANGCSINGYVENSILFRGVTVEKEAVVKNSIIMPKGVIGSSAFIQNLILDKKVQILDKVTMLGDENRPLIISKKQIIPLQVQEREEEMRGEQNEDTMYSI